MRPSATRSEYLKKEIEAIRKMLDPEPETSEGTVVIDGQEMTRAKMAARYPNRRLADSATFTYEGEVITVTLAPWLQALVKKDQETGQKVEKECAACGDLAPGSTCPGCGRYEGR